ncbi:MAG: phosphoglucomutase/phosphomannomutase family protein [Chloroflexi bacterium]|nr:phosphoglucomutase/phosphomannomutase family protein [Chloroflexota bacterium]
MSSIKFGTDGWRARIAEDYTFENVRYCAQGTASYLVDEGLADRGMVVGYDLRFLSEDFAKAVAEVLAGNGVRVYLADRAEPTPVLSYAILPRKAAGGIWITASHNPPQDNGYKLRSSYAGAADPETLAEVEARIAQAQETRQVKRMDYDQGVKQGLIQEVNIEEDYIAQIRKLVDLEAIREAGLRLAVDPMWGVGQGWFPRLIGGGKTAIREIHNVRNPIFPEMRRPEPIDENLKPLLALVPEWGADVGIATDGDADRVGLVNEKGRFVNQLEVYALLSYYLLQVRGLRGPLVRTISSTVMADKLAKLYGVEVYQTNVGFKYVAPEMLRVDALMGGEESGGFAFRGHIPERDGLLAGLYLLDLMVKKNKKPSELLQEVFALVGPHYYDRVDRRMPAEDKPAVQERIEKAEPQTLAGFRVTDIQKAGYYRFALEDGGWLLIRFSGTEPVIRVYCETTDQDRVQELLREGLRMAGLPE